MQQKQKPKRKRKKRIKFEADKVFVQPKEKELEELLQEDILTYQAKKGQAGDRGGDPITPTSGYAFGIALAKRLKKNMEKSKAKLKHSVL